MFVYHQISGLMLHNHFILGVGYAGNAGHKNDPDSQHLKNKGPLPCGIYQIGQSTTRKKLGKLAIPLWPDKNNEMFGRSGFYIHGDSAAHPGEASSGCIVIEQSIRQRIEDSLDKWLVVVP